MATSVDPRPPASQGASAGYREVVDRFKRLVGRALPPSATVAVVSKGDHQLLNIEGRRAWHFPQRADGVYAGYYPPDDASAIAHLETIRARGADFLALPLPALWWLEHYPEFSRHLDTRYRLLVRDDKAGVIYALFEPGVRRDERGNGSSAAEPRQASPIEEQPEAPSVLADPSADSHGPLAELVKTELVDDLRLIFDPEYYADQTGAAFESADDALHHYLTTGYRAGRHPHPLFDSEWYTRRYPEVKLALANPLLHFLEHSLTEAQDPNPYFDTEYYYSQGPSLRENGVNALAHYLKNGPTDAAYRPNPLFGGGFYLTAYPDVRSSGMVPLAHYLQFGCSEGRFVSQVHQSIVQHIQRSSRRALVRGSWRRGTVLFFVGGSSGDDGLNIAALAEGLAKDYRLDSIVVASERSRLSNSVAAIENILVLDDFRVACEIVRPSALRLLAKTLTSVRPLFAVSEAPEILEGLRIAGIGTYFAPSGGSPDASLTETFEQAKRVLLPSSVAFHAAAAELGRYPTNVARFRRLDEPASSEISSRALMELAKRDFDLDPAILAPNRPSVRRPTRKVVIPCSDWNVSGVNASLEAVGKELIRLGWDVEIVFTRDESLVVESAGDESHLPAIPYRFLRRRRHGLQGMWEALIAEIETQAPCIVFMGYDFLANGVAPALTENVGVVAWAQADDGDYYEQVYRLGRYCNAVVCVSECIKRNVNELHPLIGKRAHVIHNSSVWAYDVATSRSARTETMRIVYTGRLVQYQKRVLDYLELARALDRVAVPYTISLIGTFSAHENAQGAFEREAKAHLEDGRIRLLGRMPRARILEALDNQDLFVLLSDFEGFPLALVEAMARGCVPVVAESNSGIPELLKDGDNGLVVRGRDYDEWARLVTDLWRDRRRLSLMAKRARGTVRKQFTVEQAAKKFDELFRRVADEIATGTYERPPSLNWGDERSMTGDVLPPPSLLRPNAVHVAGLG